MRKNKIQSAIRRSAHQVYTLGNHDEINCCLSLLAALDVHQAKLTVCLLSATDNGDVVTEVREFGGFKRDRREMSTWVAAFHPERVVMPKGHKWKAPAFTGKAPMRRWSGMA